MIQMIKYYYLFIFISRLVRMFFLPSYLFNVCWNSVDFIDETSNSHLYSPYLVLIAHTYYKIVLRILWSSC